MMIVILVTVSNADSLHEIPLTSMTVLTATVESDTKLLESKKSDKWNIIFPSVVALWKIGLVE